MNYIELLFLVLIGIFVVLGLFIGFGRGGKRAIFRLLLIAASFIIAWIFKDKLVDKLESLELFPVDGNKVNIIEYINANLQDEMKNISYLLEYIVTMILTALSFVIIFIVLKLLTLIVYAILKGLFSKKNGKHTLLGGIVGAFAGVVIAFAICVPINGILNEVAKLSEIEIDGSKVIDLDGLGAQANPKEYADSTVSKTLSKIGNGFFAKLTTIKTDEGKNLTLDEEIEAIVFVSNMSNDLGKISKVDFSEGLNEENISEVKDILTNLDNLKSEMSEGSVDIINKAIKDVAASLGEDLPIDLNDFDLSEVEFVNEGNILEQAYNYQTSGTIDADSLIKSLANSKLILPMAKTTDFKLELNESQQAEIEAAISKLENIDSETINDIKNMFNLNK